MSNAGASLPTLRGQWVNLRPLCEADAELTFAWRQGARAQLLNQGAESVEQQARWIANRPACEYNFIIETKTQRPLGMLSLSGIDSVNRVRTGPLLDWRRSRCTGHSGSSRGHEAALRAGV